MFAACGCFVFVFVVVETAAEGIELNKPVFDCTMLLVYMLVACYCRVLVVAVVAAAAAKGIELKTKY